MGRTMPMGTMATMGTPYGIDIGISPGNMPGKPPARACGGRRPRGGGGRSSTMAPLSWACAGCGAAALAETFESWSGGSWRQSRRPPWPLRKPQLLQSQGGTRLQYPLLDLRDLKLHIKPIWKFSIYCVQHCTILP